MVAWFAWLNKSSFSEKSLTIIRLSTVRNMSQKLNIAFYGAASCGGCQIAVLEINEKILDVVKVANIVFWPMAQSNKNRERYHK